MLRRVWLRAVTGAAMVGGVAAGSAGMPDPGAGRGERAGAASQRLVAVRAQDVRLQDALEYWSSVTGVPVEPLWIGGRHGEGLDPERRLSLGIEAGPIEVLEAILSAADEGEGGGATWQATRLGTLQVGPRSRLNAYRNVEVYDVTDLLRETPHFADAPAIDLEAALSRSPGGSVIRGGSEEGWVRERTDADAARELIELIMETVEPEQWVENGGTVASIRPLGTALVVNAPGYVHRALETRRVR
jgi:hypothetical protein